MRHSTIRLGRAGHPGPAVQAFAPGRVNLIGEHTDYNDGLCLPFAVERGVTVCAEPLEGVASVEAHALELDEEDRFTLGGEGTPADAPEGWRAFVRGAASELAHAGIALRPCRLQFESDLPREAGLSSSAALSISLCLALCAVAGAPPPDRVSLARLCSRIENDWCGAETGLLDQLASLCGKRGHAVRMDMTGPHLRPVPLALRGHVLVTLDSGASRSLAASGYNERREECRAACRRLGVESLRDLGATEDEAAIAALPDPLDRRVRHVLSENARVDASVRALEEDDLEELGRLLGASHASLRDDYEVSVPEVERTVERCRRAGALGARIMGGGFGGSVLALFSADAEIPEGALRVEPGPPARLLDPPTRRARPPAGA
jgi:galactokinase